MASSRSSGAHRTREPAIHNRGLVIMDCGLPRCARAPERPQGASHGWSSTARVRPSRPRALAAVRVEIDRAVRNREAEGRADGAFDEANLTAVGAHQFGDDGEPEPNTAGAGRALERFE